MERLKVADFAFFDILVDFGGAVLSDGPTLLQINQETFPTAFPTCLKDEKTKETYVNAIVVIFGEIKARKVLKSFPLN